MTRQVALSEEAYRTLSKMKGKEMSFSDIVLRLAGGAIPKRNFLKLAGALRARSSELERFKRQIAKDRKKNTEAT